MQRTRQHVCNAFYLSCVFSVYSPDILERGRLEGISDFALLLYLAHPMMIVMVRLFAGLTGLQKVLVENSLIHFRQCAPYPWQVLPLWLSSGAGGRNSEEKLRRIRPTGRG